MARNGADILIETLIAFGVDTIYGMPGDGINGIMEAIRTHGDKVRFIQVRHEESAAFAAAARASASSTSRSAASSAPLSTSGSTPRRSSTPARNTSALEASRVAEVATIRTRVTPSRCISST